ncbi:MAG: hypothetical protein AAF945_05480 [Actinomycetota bacterium]
MRRRRTAAVVAAAGATVVAIVGLNSSASANDIVIDIDGAVGGNVGEVIVLTEQPVADEFVGAECLATLRAENNSSVHPGNDLIVSSGGTSTRLDDVEGSPGNVISGTGPVVLGDTITVELEFGQDGRSSGGLTVELDCEQTAPPPTDPPETTVPETTVPETTVPETTVPGAPETTVPETETTTTQPGESEPPPEAPVDPPVSAEPDFTG